MSGGDRTDALIAQWLSDGPTEASDRLIEAILESVLATSSESAAVRRTFGFRGTRLLGGAIVAALIVAVASVGGLAGRAPAGPAQAGPVSSAPAANIGSARPSTTPVTGMGGPWVSYVSPQPAFSVAYPATWRAAPDYFRDGRPPILAFAANDRDAVIFVSFGTATSAATMPCGPIGGPPDATRCVSLRGSGVDELESAYGRFIEHCCGAKPDPSTEHLLVAGTPAVLMETWNEPLVEGSVRDFTLAAVLVREGGPVAIVWTSALDDHVADRLDFLRFLGTVRFGR